MAQGTVTTQPQGRSFIIKRPRLTKLLDESEARIILLVAPAGYGKTTLAREWVAEKEGVAWYSGKPAMADVAALAADIAAVIADHKSSVESVRALASRDALPAALANALAKRASSNCSILVIDDCYYTGGSPESEELLGEFVARADCRLLLTSRTRPKWIESRMIIYGEIDALDASQLAFTHEEAEQVAQGSSTSVDADVLERAGGWPAVIGLAARRPRTPVETSLPSDELYDYFANELFRHTTAETQRTLMLLALGADASAEVGKAVFEADYDLVLMTAAECGFLSGAASDTRIHPLLRGFLLAKLRELPPDETESMVRAVLDVLTARGLWDESIAALEVAPVADLVSATLQAALHDLLALGRLATVRRWLALARTVPMDDPVLLLADAEIALRNQDHVTAQVLGERAGNQIGDGDAASRAYIVAARAAHLRDDRRAVASSAERALACTTTLDLRTTALWTAFASAIEWSAQEASAVLDQLRLVPDTRPDHALRVLNAEGWLLLDSGRDLRAAAEKFAMAYALIPHVRDPLLTTGLLNVFAHTTVHLAEYEQALTLVEQLIEDAEDNGVVFAVDHALITRASALIGQRKLLAAERTLRELTGRSPAATAHVTANQQLQQVRLLIAIGDLERASFVLQEDQAGELPPQFFGELCAYRGLVWAAQGGLPKAEMAFNEARLHPECATTLTLCELGQAVLELQKESDAAARLSIRALTHVMTVGHRDAVVTCARAFPELIRVGASDDACARALTGTLNRSADIDLGRNAGLQMPRELRRNKGLSQREREVYELLVQGRTNREIASALFISESTTKVHVRHIFEKLGVHSRAEAAKGWTEHTPA